MTLLTQPGTATDAVRDQVMQHNPNSAVHNRSYINERVRFDVQSAVLERPSADGVLRMLTHMSLMRDPRAPVHVPDDVLAALPLDPDIASLAGAGAVKSWSISHPGDGCGGRSSAAYFRNWKC